MDPLPDVQASALIITAHDGLPAVPPTADSDPTAVPSSPQLEYVGSTGTTTNLVGSVSGIVKEVDELSKNVPYIKGLGESILQIAEIRDVSSMRPQ